MFSLIWYTHFPSLVVSSSRSLGNSSPPPALRRTMVLSFNPNVPSYMDGSTHRALQQPPPPRLFVRRRLSSPRVGIDVRVPTERTAIPWPSVRFVSSRDAHSDADTRFNGGLSGADSDGTISRPRCRRLNVSGSTIFPRHEGALDMEGSVRPSHRRCPPRILSLWSSE